MITEKFIPMKNYKNLYLISNTGKIFSLRKNRLLKIHSDNSGYFHVSLVKNKKRKTFLIHRLVANNFILNLFDKKYINHIDGNKSNNKLNNLEWVTHQENINHAFKNGLNKSRKGERSNFSKLTDKQREKIKLLFNKNKSKMIQYKKLSNLFNISQRQIRYILNGR